LLLASRPFTAVCAARFWPLRALERKRFPAVAEPALNRCASAAKPHHAGAYGACAASRRARSRRRRNRYRSFQQRTIAVKKILKTILLGGLLGAWIGGCMTEPSDSAQPETMGEVGLDLQVAQGLTLNTVNYTITGPLAFSRMGTIDVSNSTTVSAVISRIP
jgi:hypothetical protein